MVCHLFQILAWVNIMLGRTSSRYLNGFFPHAWKTLCQVNHPSAFFRCFGSGDGGNGDNGDSGGGGGNDGDGGNGGRGGGGGSDEDAVIVVMVMVKRR